VDPVVFIRKSPTLDTADRILGCAGFDLVAVPRVVFRECSTRRGRPFYVADQWWTVPPERAFAVVALPLSINWSMPNSTYVLSDRAQRARYYEIVLREGGPDDIVQHVDGSLAIDLWNELVLPREIRAAWQPLVDAVAA
jgi:hypothetical protein